MIPLAHKLKPTSLTEIVGQEHLLNKSSFLRRAILRDEIPSMILYGPPGCGKTSLAYVIAKTTKSNFVVVNAVSAGIKDLRNVIEKAKSEKKSLFNKKTILFIDEIHRFNKKQQDYLLPFVERGVVILIGATTENPSFEVNSALLSRMQVFVLKALTEENIKQILAQALSKIKEQKIVSFDGVKIDAKYLDLIAFYSHGDARFALNILEQIFKEISAGQKISEKLLKDIMQNKALMYDKNGEEHYNIISALHKSMRDGDADAAVYWTMRMIKGGEDPKYIVRRMIRFASEDIGNANPEALRVAIATKEAVLFLGLPECNTALVQCAIYLAKSPKSNACYVATQRASDDIEKLGPLPVPLHLRNAATKLMKEWGYGKGYKYAHDFKNAKVNQEHLPKELKGRKYYRLFAK
ncbi:MAG TPA: replication-associated recombination protein A [Candidatus Moranbacteria bacterium]|nr:replication-associated recombination protein A [Candidatus Moranbacteria bacterium]